MPQTIRCKLVCTETGRSRGWTQEHPFVYRVVLIPVMGTSEENKKFFAATPSGKLELFTLTEDHFEPGKEYYVDISPAE